MIEILFCMHVVLLFSAWFTSGCMVEPVLFLCMSFCICCSPPGLPVGTWLNYFVGMSYPVLLSAWFTSGHVIEPVLVMHVSD